MIYLNISFLFIISTIGCMAQTSLNFNNYKQLAGIHTKHESLNTILKFKVINDRYYHQNSIDETPLINEINALLLDYNIINSTDINPLLDKVKPAVINVYIKYLSFYENSSNDLFLKSICEVNIEKGDFLTTNEEFIVQESIPCSFKLKHFRKGKKKDEVNLVAKHMFQLIAKNIVDKVEDLDSNLKGKVYLISDFGCSIDSSDVSSKLEAIRNGSEKVFEIKLEINSTLTDFADVTDYVQSTLNCNILAEQIRDEFTLYLDDGRHCSFVDAIIKQ